MLRGENKAALEIARRTGVAVDMSARYEQYGMSEQALWDRIAEMDEWWRETTWCVPKPPPAARRLSSQLILISSLLVGFLVVNVYQDATNYSGAPRFIACIPTRPHVP